MCEPWPGPRCSYDMSKKRLAREGRVLKDVKKFGANSPQALLALARLENADNEYNATPEGVARLQKAIKENPEDSTPKNKLALALTTRAMQVNAANEIKSGRVKNLTNVISGLTDFYEPAEIKSVIESSREDVEKTALRSPTNVDLSAKEKDYKRYLGNIETALNKKHPQGLPTDVAESLQSLKVQDAPDAVNMKAYDNLPPALDKARAQLVSEIRNVSALQGVEPSVAAEYYEAYRKQYAENFAHLSEKDRPDPPEHWVRGEFSQSGYTKDPTSSFAPHDAASIYAMYRLRSDDSAIPDYVKNSMSIASVNLSTSGGGTKETTSPSKGTIDDISIVSYSPEGKKIDTFSHSIKNSPNWNNASINISSQLRGKMLLSANVKQERSWLSTHVEGFNAKRTPSIDPIEISRKHFDLPDHKMKTICDNNDIPYRNSSKLVTEAQMTGEVFFKLRKTVKKTWSSKPARNNAPVIAEIPSNSRWVKAS
jgi:hypothetical protein